MDILRANAYLHAPLRNVDIVMLMAGTNNISPKLGVGRQVTTVPAFKKQYFTLLETVRVKYPNAHIIVHDLFPRFDSGRWQYELSHTDMAKNTFKVMRMLLAKFPLTNLWKIFAVVQHIGEKLDQSG